MTVITSGREDVAAASTPPVGSWHSARSVIAERVTSSRLSCGRSRLFTQLRQ